MTSVNATEAEEILQFLAPNAFGNVKGIAMEYFLGLTGSEEGINFIASNPKFLTAIINLTDDSVEVIKKDAYFALINLTTVESVATQVSANEDFLFNSLKYILQPNSLYADIVCKVLCNMSRVKICAHRLVTVMVQKRAEVGFDKVIQVFCRESYNEKNDLHFLGPFLSNLTQIKQARHYILDKEKCVVQRLLPYTCYEGSVIRRGGVVGALKNCCFESGQEYAFSPSSAPPYIYCHF